jgi:site-specific recombinase XerD
VVSNSEAILKEHLWIQKIKNGLMSFTRNIVITYDCKAKKTIEVYSFALKRFTKFIDRSPDTATKDDFKRYFKSILETQSWSTIKVNRVGLMFFYHYVLEKDWAWIDIVKPPKIKSIANVLTQVEVKRLLLSIKKMRYRIFF